jgi:signal transduction histidine kinase
MSELLILLVEDNPTDALLVETTLDELAGWTSTLTHVDRLSLAEELLAEESYDVILLDLNLPDGQGLNNFVRLQEAAHGIPIIVLTGLADEVTALAAIQQGAADYLIKGTPDARLLERSIKYAIERKKNEDSRLELSRAQIARYEAEAANRLKDEFLATLSHELRTPLNSILGWTSLLKVGNLSDVERKQALDTIERSARIQTSLVEDLLDVSRVVTGKLNISLKACDICATVRAAVDALRPFLTDHNLTVNLDLEPLPPVRGDSMRLQQVVWNLISNAGKFSPDGGQIWVTLRQEEFRDGVPCLTLKVRDEGQGISAEFLPQVFDRFRQADSSSTRRHGGLGLGLAIVQHIVGLHDGEVEAQSDGPGRGATFVVRLPRLPIEIPTVPG